MTGGFDALVRAALEEDIGEGDITTESTVPAEARCSAELIAKQPGVLSGITVFRRVFDLVGAGVEDWSATDDGGAFSAGDRLAVFTGKTRQVLTGERVALNFVQRLSGVATMTAAFVEAVRGLNVDITDTRKTTPLLRGLQKQAVLHGGGVNHRAGLYDAVLIKENHIAAAGGIANAVRQALEGAHHPDGVGIEVTSVEEFDEAIKAGAKGILLDNMTLEEMRHIVERARGKDVELEASGNVTLESVRAIAETGVHVISIGALTHSAPAIDMSMVVTDA